VVEVKVVKVMKFHNHLVIETDKQILAEELGELEVIVILLVDQEEVVLYT
jgi:hypothetical protein